MKMYDGQDLVGRGGREEGFCKYASSGRSKNLMPSLISTMTFVSDQSAGKRRGYDMLRDLPTWMQARVMRERTWRRG